LSLLHLLFTVLFTPLSLSTKETIITMDIIDLSRGAQRGLTFGPFKDKRLEAIMDSIFKGIFDTIQSSSKPQKSRRLLVLLQFRVLLISRDAITLMRPNFALSSKEKLHVPKPFAIAPPPRVTTRTALFAVSLGRGLFLQTRNLILRMTVLILKTICVLLRVLCFQM
jgi:hypothetical protein